MAPRRPMPLVNLRDVGGLPAADGLRVAPGRLFRSAAPLPGDAVPDLRPWPPRTVIDLRARGEAVTDHHPLASAATQVVALPLSRDLDLARPEADDRELGDLPEIYVRTVRALGVRLAEIVALVAASPGPSLVHCAAGKDRTGIAIAVTLAGAGVLPDAIVADYRRTEEHAALLPDRMAQGWRADRREELVRRYTVERPDLLRAPASAIEAVLDVLQAWEGGAAGWLVDHGLPPDSVEALRQRLLLPRD